MADRRWVETPSMMFVGDGGRLFFQPNGVVMRVGIDARLVYYSQAGIGQYIIHLVNGLAKVDTET
ncbi:MAG TPA: hypothetical protein ENJ31_08110, partial [Anaerolineae bacterium]|nr:hypothetical protein [Anaerolineae bacterium]